MDLLNNIQFKSWCTIRSNHIWIHLVTAIGRWCTWLTTIHSIAMIGHNVTWRDASTTMGLIISFQSYIQIHSFALSWKQTRVGHCHHDGSHIWMARHWQCPAHSTVSCSNVCIQGMAATYWMASHPLERFHRPSWQPYMDGTPLTMSNTLNNSLFKCMYSGQGSHILDGKPHTRESIDVFLFFSYTMRSVCLWLTVSLRLYMVRSNTDRQTDSDTSGPPADWQSQWQTFNVSHPGQQTDSDTHHNSQCWRQQPDKLNTMYSIEFGWRGGHSMHG